MIVNASPLIIFGKLNRIDILKKICVNIKITASVYDEVVVKGAKVNSRDALIVEGCIKNKDIIIIELNEKSKGLAENIKKICYIDIGEADTIALALQLNKKEAVIDEKAAREAAKAFGIKPVGSLRVLLIAYQKGMINKLELNSIIKEMINSKYRLSPQVLMEFWSLAEKIKINK